MVFNKLDSLGIIFTFFCSLFSVAQEFRFDEKSDGILFLENDSPRYFYRTVAEDTMNPYSRTNYIHPLYGLDGEILTEDFTRDHPHHHGIFWAWHQFYVRGKRIADPWLNEGIQWKVLNTQTEVLKKAAILSSEVLWVYKASSEAVIREDLQLSFQRIQENVFSLNFRINLTALVEGVAIGGSEDAKGYGGFSARLKLPENVKFNGAEGEVKPKNLPVQAGSWINISGYFDPALFKTSGIVIMGEPESLPSFQGWILRRTDSMQNMAFPGKTPIKIEKGETLTFRNQILVHRDLNTKEIESIYRKFRNNLGSGRTGN